MKKYTVIAYRTNYTYKYGARGDIAVLKEDGSVEIITDKCLCGWCVKTCELQAKLVAELLDGAPHMVGWGRGRYHPYPRGTRGKWFVLPSYSHLAHLLPPPPKPAPVPPPHDEIDE